MTTADNNRLEMHLRLKEVLGDTVGDTVMRSLPPVDWSEFARKSDVEALARLTEVRFAAVDARLASIESRLSGIVAGMWAMGSLTVTLFVAQFTLLITKL